tara:strand:- start:6953 stop:10255 length:3303 start_codon:yes stop_codon:yes gene_type:complete
MGASVRDSLDNYRLVSLHSWERIPRDPFILFGGNILASATATQIFITQAINYLAIAAISSWAIKALMPKPDFGAFGSSSGLLANTRTATAPQEIVYGTVRKGGVVTYIESTGATNKFLHQIIVLAGHEVNQIGNVYINDVTVTIGADHFVSDARWKDDSNNPKIYIRKFLGADNQDVYSQLNGITDPPEWNIDGVAPSSSEDTNFKGEGIACLYVRMEYDQNVFAEGIPLFTAIVEGKKVYDPRSSSTAFSANAALCIRDYLTSAYGVDNTGVTNDTVFSAAANTCDENVTLSGGGTEKRYELNGVVSLDRSPSDILGDMMTSCAATLFWGQGNWQLKVGEYTAAVKTFTLDDFRSGINLETKPSRRDSFNIVRGMFNNAADDYVRADYPEIRSSTFITNDAGVESAIDLALPFTTSSAMAQRLAKMTLFRARESMTLTADFGLDAFNVQVGDVVAITNSRYGFSAKDFEVVGWKFSNKRDSGELSVSLTLRETSSAAFSWSAEESEILSNNSTLTDIRAGLSPSNVSVTDIGSVQLDGTFVTQARVSWTAATSKFLNHYEIEWKKTTDNNYFRTEIPASDTAANISPLESGAQYNVRVRGVGVKGNVGSWVAASAHTVGGDTTAPSAISGLTATGGAKQITLDWTAPTTQVGGATLYDLKGYNIYRATTNSQPASPIAFSGSDKFVDAALAVNTQYYYWVTAVDFSGNESAASSSVNATTDAATSGADTDTRIFSGLLYYSTLQATAPSAPTDDTGTFSVANANFSSPPTGWSHSQTTVSNTSFTEKEWTVGYTVEVNVSGTVLSITYGSVNGAFQITDTIESSNFSTGSAGWQIKNNGDAEFGAGVIRGTLQVGQIPDLSSTYAASSDIPTNTSQLNNNSGFITSSSLSGYATTSQLNSKSTVYYQSSQPSGSAGDLWFHTSQGKYYHFNGSSWQQASIEADSIVSSYVYAGTINAGNITAGTLSVDRMPQLGQANTTIFNNSVTRNGSAASVTTSFSGVKSGAKFVAILSVGGNAGNVASPYGRVTPTGSSVSLNSSASRDISFKEGGTTTREFYVMLSTGTTSSTSGSVGFTIQLRGNDSGGGYTYGTLAALILSG